MVLPWELEPSSGTTLGAPRISDVPPQGFGFPPSWARECHASPTPDAHVILHMKRTSRIPRSDHDAYWKEAFDVFLPDLLEFFAPDIAAAIDWSRGYSIAKIELRPDARNSATRLRRPDRVYRVRLRNGRSAILYIHFEFQSRAEPGFEARMFVYHTRLYLHLNQPVVSLAILADLDPRYRPSEFRVRAFGNDLRFRFRICKIIDHRDRIAELIASGNVAALLVAIKLVDLLVADPMERFARKKEVLRVLATNVRGRTRRTRLTRLLIEGIILGTRQTREFANVMRRLESELEVPFTTVYEREAEARGRAQGARAGKKIGTKLGKKIGKKIGHRVGAAEGRIRGRRDALIRVLRTRFRTIGPRTLDRIEAVASLVALDRLLEAAVTVGNVAEFRRRLGRTSGPKT